MHVIKNHGAKIFLIFPLSLESFFSLSLFPSFIFLLFDAAQKGFALFLISFQASYLIIIVRSRDVKNTENRFSFPRLLFFERNVYDMVYIIIRYTYIYIFACSDRENYDHDNWFRYTLNFISSAWRIFDYLRFRVFTIHRSYRRETRRNAYWRRR